VPDPENLAADFFRGDEEARAIFVAIRGAVALLGEATLRVSKSQIAFRRRIAFGWVWLPGKYLKGKRPPLVLTIGLHRHDFCARWKQVVEPYPGRFVHHMELNAPEQVDQEVRALLAEARSAAG
jgi:hypothetical protein